MRPPSDAVVAALAEERWSRWRTAIRLREPVALGALERVVDGMLKTSLPPLTAREIDVLREYAAGATSAAEAGAALGISSETVRAHVKKARARMGARNVTEAVAMAIREGVI